jgi:hypothetical protein
MKALNKIKKNIQMMKIIYRNQKIKNNLIMITLINFIKHSVLKIQVTVLNKRRKEANNTKKTITKLKIEDLRRIDNLQKKVD